MEKLVQTGAIKPSSVGWLTGAIDPFHDYAYDIEGLPDAFGGSTVVQFIKQQVVITAPAGLGPNDNWDCHIFSLPLMDTETGRSVSYRTDYLLQDMTTPFAMGTLCINSGVSGGVLVPDSPAWVAPTAFRSIGRSPTDFGNSFSMMRLVGGGFEVHNNTEELHKKGSVTVYTQPQSLQLGQGLVAVEGDARQLFSNWFSGRCPPQTIAQAVSNTNARTWEAKEGCYVPFRLQADRGDYALATSIPVVFPTVDNSADYGSTYGGMITELDIVAAAAPADAFLRADTPVRITNHNTVGAYFTGLGPETVLTLDIRFIVEIAPTPNNQTLISLASPSAAFDPVALELYTKAVAELPPGVMVKFNGNGKWWETVKNVLAKASPMIASMGPYGAIASKVIDSVPKIEETVKGLMDAAKEVKEARQAARSANPRDTKGKKNENKPVLRKKN